MPDCHRCERTFASAELRRTAKGHVCKDKIACKRRSSSKKHLVLKVTGGKVAFTNTSTIPDEEIVREIRALAKVIDCDQIVMHFKKCGYRRSAAGRAYWSIPSIANLRGLRRIEWRWLIVVTDNANWRDTLAHEVKHIEQARNGKRPSEPPCYAFSDWWMKKRTELVKQEARC